METTAEAPAADIDEPIPKRSDVTKAVRNVFNRHLAHEGIMLDRMQRQLRSAERLQKFAATGKISDLEPTAEEAEIMGVNIGNETHNHFQIEMKDQPEPASSVLQAASKSLWPKLLVGASLLAGGSGLGYLIHGLTQPAATTPSAVDTDTDTIVELDFPPE